MQLFTFLQDGKPRYARKYGEYGIALSRSASAYSKGKITPRLKSLITILEDEGIFSFIQEATDWVAEQIPDQLEALIQEDLVFHFDRAEVMAPIPSPGKVICVAGNFPASNKMPMPAYPTIFLKPTSTVNGHLHPIILPDIAKNTACEGELALVIAKTCRNISAREAPGCLAGFSIANDLGDRSLESRTSQWTSGKMFDTYTPMGPVLVTPDELSQLTGLQMVTRLNGELVQKGSTSQMFFDPLRLVSMISELTTLQPGDVILTGSPKLIESQAAPAHRLKPGDRVDISIDRLGSLSNPVIAESEAGG